MDITQLINLFAFSTGRRLFALRRVQDQIQWESEKLRTHLTQALEHDLTTRRVEAQWQRDRDVEDLRRTGAREADLQLERAISGTHQHLLALMGTFARLPRGLLAARVIRSVFPAGVQAITQQRYEDVVASADQILLGLRELTAGELDLLSLSAHLELLDERVGALRRCLVKSSEGEVTFDEVRALRAAGQRRLVTIVALIIAEFPEDTPQDTRNRTRLLFPILEQNERLRPFCWRAGPVPDVDPDTGAELLPAED